VSSLQSDPAPGAADPLRVLFICQFDFSAAAEKQVLGFAQQLVRRGVEVLICLGGDEATAAQEGADRLQGLSVHRYQFAGRRLRRADVEVARRFGPSVVHAWNSRVPTMAAAREIATATERPLFVHFEDDEWRLPEHPPDETLKRRVGHIARRLLSNVLPSVWWHSTRRSLRHVSRHATALDALTPTLADEVHRRLGRTCQVVLPVTPEPVAATEPAEPVTLGPGPPVLLITGTIWPAYLPDFLVAFRAVSELQRRGREVRLIHAGRIHPDWTGEALAVSAGIADGAATFLGYLPYAAIPGLLAQAVVLLQPGPPSEFNRLRLPSKLQGYLESGTPTITFAVGFGELLEDRVEALKTYTGDPAELADRIVEVLDDPELRDRLAAGGRVAASRLFDPRRNTDALLAHYQASAPAVSSE
jgi:glycosyltransferase involved in cell wall biosynthesis